MSLSYTAEELELAKSADLVAIAESLGYSPQKVGRYYTLKEMDSIRIYNRRTWFRWSREYDKGENGGSQIDFLRVFAGLDVKEAVFWILDFMGYRQDINKAKSPLKHRVSEMKTEKKEFALPVMEDGCSYLYGYLMKKRGLSKRVIDHFLFRGLIYESKPYHNIVFKGNDVNGVTKFASMRGVYERDGNGFKCDVPGNDKQYGFNISYGNCHQLVVFEGAIDMMSYVDIYSDFETHKLALGMLSDAPLKTFLEEHPEVSSIRFCLDNDEPGRKATKQLLEKYYGLGYEVEDCPPPNGCKDYNEWLVHSGTHKAVEGKVVTNDRKK